ncbi:MAG: aspartate dehydrogenase domain-containing protein, partial [Bdellovibrionales bacterium]
DPAAKGNTHSIEVVGAFSTIRSTIENTPDPKNPKSSMLAAQSIVSVLEDMNSAIVIG